MYQLQTPGHDPDSLEDERKTASPLPALSPAPSPRALGHQRARGDHESEVRRPASCPSSKKAAHTSHKTGGVRSMEVRGAQLLPLTGWDQTPPNSM